MGLLDEAIREHLELKRRRGADAGEISREETEALGPVRRSPDGTPDLASMLPQPVADPAHHDDPTGVEAEPDWDDETTIHAPLPATPTPGDYAPPPAAAPQHYAEPAATPPATPAPADYAPPPSPPASAPRDYAPAHEPQAASAPPPVHAPAPAHPPAAFDEAFDDDAPLAPLDDEPLPEAPRGKRRLGGLLRRRSADPDPDPAPEPAPQALDDLDPPTAAHATPPPLPPATPAPYQPPPAAPPMGEPAGEDLLEETPEFLEETPDHDRLWFEQRPPRDFDFDG